MVEVLVLTVCAGLAVGRFFRRESQKEGGLRDLFVGLALLPLALPLALVAAVCIFFPAIPMGIGIDLLWEWWRD